MSDTLLIPLIIIAFLIIFPLMWFAIVTLTMKMAGMSRRVDTSPIGQKISTLGTGSARIRGMNFGSTLRVDRHEHGYLMSLPKIFGAGKLVVADEEIVAITKRGQSFGRSTVIELRNGRSIRLFGRLADALG